MVSSLDLSPSFKDLDSDTKEGKVESQGGEEGAREERKEPGRNERGQGGRKGPCYRIARSHIPDNCCHTENKKRDSMNKTL